ncbi:MAG: YfcE family phosphodiesterase [Anaerolineae bacterium]|nr:YfcE family phosphodiesterase [Anaerolineae bacterium]
MRIGILSDTHNNLVNLRAALAIFQQEGIQLLLHCGDLTSPETAAMLQGFQVIHVFGNNDYASGAIRQTLLDLNPLNYSGMTYTGSVDGVTIGAAHGHLTPRMDELTARGDLAYLFTGHSHRRRDEQHGATRIINPGALGGLKVEERSIFILDLHSGAGRFVIL